MSERILVKCLHCKNTHNVMSRVDFKCPNCENINVWNGVMYRKELSVIQKTISIASEDGTFYKFEKPEFKCELLCVGKHGDVIGCVTTDHVGFKEVTLFWDNSGTCFTTSTNRTKDTRRSEFNLTPIKKVWYENHNILSKENPKLMVIKETNMLIWVYGYELKCFLILEYFYEQGFSDENKVRLATKEEVMSLY